MENNQNQEIPLLAGRYKMGPIIGQGGMGTVYSALDTRLQRDVAIKFMKREVMNEDGVIESFKYESELLGALEHPGILPVIDSGIDETGIPYCVMKVIRGKTLGELIFEQSNMSGENRKHSVIRLLRIFSKLCETLAFIHHKGYIHRDIKPENIMVDEFGVVILVDWGLARAMSSGDNRPDASKTSTGLVKGTPLYMSPEQIVSSSAALDGRSDLFAMGVILYEVLVGKTPFDATDAYAILAKIKRGKFISPREARSDIPRPLESIVIKALEIEADKRYQSTAELGADVDSFLDGSSVEAHIPDLWERLSYWLKNYPEISGGILTLLFVLFVFAGIFGLNRYALNVKLEEQYRAFENANSTIDRLEREIKDKRATLALINSDDTNSTVEQRVGQELSYRKSLANKAALSFILQRNIMGLINEQKEFFGTEMNEAREKALKLSKESLIGQLNDMLADNNYFRTHYFCSLYLTDVRQKAFQWSGVEQDVLRGIQKEAFEKLKQECRNMYGADYPPFNWSEEIEELRQLYYLLNK
jgi:serine/threonine protein kinase